MVLNHTLPIISLLFFSHNFLVMSSYMFFFIRFVSAPSHFLPLTLYLCTPLVTSSGISCHMIIINLQLTLPMFTECISAQQVCFIIALMHPIHDFYPVYGALQLTDFFSQQSMSLILFIGVLLCLSCPFSQCNG